MKTAQKIKRMNNFRGIAVLYRCNPPLIPFTNGPGVDSSYANVVVSSVETSAEGPTTAVFGSDADGNVLCWIELQGSARGIVTHHEALAAAGYEVTL
jgi:hypothetical protein